MAGVPGGRDERRLDTRARRDGDDPPGQRIGSGGGEVLPQADQHGKGDLGRDSRELGDHALAGDVVPAQPQQVVEAAGEDPRASDQQVDGALDVAACERLLQAGAEPRLDAPGGDLAQELGGAREATRVVAGPQVAGQSLPPL